MAILLLALFIGVPLVEIAVFIEVGERVGILNTVIATVLTAMSGVWLLRAQGLATLTRARAQLDRGVMPAEELFDGLCLLTAGALLLVPGFVTDAIGLLLFVPPFRDFLRRVLSQRVAARGETRIYLDGRPVKGSSPGGSAPKPRRPPRPGAKGTIIEGEYEDITEDEPEDSSPSNGSRRIEP